MRRGLLYAAAAVALLPQAPAQSVGFSDRTIDVPRNGLPWEYQVALRLLERGRAAEALARLQEAAKAAPDSREVLLRFADTALDLGRPLLAAETYAALLDLDPDDAEARRGQRAAQRAAEALAPPPDLYGE